MLITTKSSIQPTIGIKYYLLPSRREESPRWQSCQHLVEITTKRLEREKQLYQPLLKTRIAKSEQNEQRCTMLLFYVQNTYRCYHSIKGKDIYDTQNQTYITTFIVLRFLYHFNEKHYLRFYIMTCRIRYVPRVFTQKAQHSGISNSGNGSEYESDSSIKVSVGFLTLNGDITCKMLLQEI